MALLKIFVITAGVAIGVALGSLHYVRKERAQEIGWLREENDRMRSEIARRQPARAPTDDARRRSSAENLVRSRFETRPAPRDDGRAPAGKTKPWPMRVYRNDGQATPVSALQTMAWACDQGDMETMGKLFVIDEEARPKAKAIYAAIMAEKRFEWRSLEEMAAAIIVHNGIEEPYPGAAVLALAKIEPINEGRVTLMLPGASVSGVVFQQTAEGWKYVISDAVVEDYIARRLTPRAGR